VEDGHVTRARGSFSTAGHGSAVGLGAVLTISQAAKLAGWSVARMRRFLVARHRESGGRVLVNVGLGSIRARWTVSLSALRALCNNWFVDDDVLREQIDYLAHRLEDTRENVATQGRRITAVHQIVMAVARDVAERPPRHLQLVGRRRGDAA
jgi:hypothetical protein